MPPDWPAGPVHWANFERYPRIAVGIQGLRDAGFAAVLNCELRFFGEPSPGLKLEICDMTILTPMTEPEFAIYLAKAIPEFAQDKMDAGQWSAEEALLLSRTGYAEQLPQGLATPDNFFFTVRDPATDSDVGMLWFAAQERAGLRIAYVYDVYIHAEHQRKGHATRAFAALDDLARQRGMAGIALHVFGHNAGAQVLYQKLGYGVTNINMFKPLGPGKIIGNILDAASCS